MRELHVNTLNKIRDVLIGVEGPRQRRRTRQIVPILRSVGMKFSDPSNFTSTNDLVDPIFLECNQTEWDSSNNSKYQLARLILNIADPREFADNASQQREVVELLNDALLPEGYEVRLLDPRRPALIDIESDEQILTLGKYGEVQESIDISKEVKSNPKSSVTMAQQVFIVHGHDRAVRDSVARFLERFGLETIVLDEQPNQGRTLIEKLETYGHVAYAIILLTPDDIGGKIDEGARTRARQNVIFELGYFVGKIGRDRVCLIQQDIEEIPSDLLGITYIKFDQDDGWMMRLAKELRAAGLKIDTSSVI